DGEAPVGGWVQRTGYPYRRAEGAEKEPGGALPRKWKTQAAFVYRTSGRCRSAAGGLDDRSVSVCRAGRIFLRAGHGRHEVRGCDSGDELDSVEEGRICAGPRLDTGAYGG